MVAVDDVVGVVDGSVIMIDGVVDVADGGCIAVVGSDVAYCRGNGGLGTASSMAVVCVMASTELMDVI